jgi:Transglutaminase-like superfamily
MRNLVEPVRVRVAPRLLLAEAIVYLLAARLALSLFSFQQLTRLFVRPAKQPELAGAERERARKEVGRAIFRVRRSSFIRTTCMHRAIAAQAMLRRRGVSTTLYYGARTLPEQGLTTHVWLQDGTQGVVGHFAAKGYYVLECYPQADDDPNTFRRAT